jgi:hypothetical protein
MVSILGDITNETLNIVYKELKKSKNSSKISYIINTLSNLALKRIQPYLYAIMMILIIIFLINCFQFYYYLKFVINYTKKDVSSLIKLDDLISTK